MEKILIFSSHIELSGLASVLITYANFLSSSYDVTYLTCDDVIDKRKVFNDEIKVISIKVERFRKALPEIIRVFRKERPHIILTGGDEANAYSIIASKFCPTRPKVIISQHNYLNVEYNAFVHKLCYRFYNQANVVIAVSKGISEFLEDNGIKRQKIKVIYNPIDIKGILEKSNEVIDDIYNNDFCLFIGRLTPVKNLKLAIDSFAHVIKIYPELKFIVIGDGSEYNNLMNYLRDKELNDNIIFLGKKNNPYPYLKRAKALLLSSLSEALPTVILEAFALGKTVVSTPTKGATDLLVEGEFGYLTEGFDNSREFADKIIKALENPISEKALLNRANNFSKDKKKSEIESVINKLYKK